VDKVEASGRTLEEALQLAAQQLGVTTDAVDYEIVEEGTKGFLGLGQTPTVVRAWRRQAEPPVTAATPPATEPIAEQAVPKIEEVPAPAEESAPEHAPTEEKGKDLVDTVLRTLNEILKPMGLRVRAELKSDSPEEVVIDLVGPDVAILIGKRGQTLDALQYLVGIITSRRATGKKRIILDAEGYRERHKEFLERKAREYAAAVKAEGKEAVLEPQPARDRRVIHLALADDPDVYTYSEGEGDERHVVISPKK